MTTKKSTTSTPSTQSTPAESTPTALAGTDLPPISDSVVSQCVSLLNQVGALIGSVDELSVLEIRHALKMRKGGAQIVPQLATLCGHNGITSVGNMTTQGMTDLLSRANSLNTISVALEALQKKVDDAAFMAESTTWQSATTFYTVLQRLTSRSPTLSVALQPIQAFFQTKRTKGNRQLVNAAAKVKAAAQAVAKHPAASSGTQSPPTPPTPPSTGASAGSPPTGSSSAGGTGAAPVAEPVPVAGGGVAAGGAPVGAAGVAAPLAASNNGVTHS